MFYCRKTWYVCGINVLSMAIPWYFEKKSYKENFNTCKTIKLELEKRAKEKQISKTDIINQALAKELGINPK